MQCGTAWLVMLSQVQMHSFVTRSLRLSGTGPVGSHSERKGIVLVLMHTVVLVYASDDCFPCFSFHSVPNFLATW